jgi:hypothetical protein
MSWPTNLPNSAAFDADADSVAASRPELKKMSDAVNTLASNVYTAGSTTGTITPDVANGEIQRITLTGNITMNAFANPVAGQRLTMIFKQPAAGSTFDLTSNMLWENGLESLTQINSAVDTADIVYDGTNYFARMNLAHGSVEVYAISVNPLQEDLETNDFLIKNTADSAGETLHYLHLGVNEPVGTGSPVNRQFTTLGADRISIGRKRDYSTATDRPRIYGPVNNSGVVQDIIFGEQITGVTASRVAFDCGLTVPHTSTTGAAQIDLLRRSKLRFIAAGAVTDNAIEFQPPASITTTTTFTLPNGDGTANQVLTTNGSGVLSWSTGSGGGINNVVEDTTPQLGGTLDMNGFQLSQTTNTNFQIQVSGTGRVTITSPEIVVSGGTNTTICTDTADSGELRISTQRGNPNVSGPGVIISPATNTQQIKLISDTDIYYEARRLHIFDAWGTISSAGDADDVILTTNGVTDLVLNTNSGTNSGSITVFDGVNGNIEIVPNGTGAIVCSDKVLRQVEFKDYAETVYNQGNVTGSFSITVANGNTQRMKLTGNITFTGFVDAREGQTITLLITQDGTGNRTFTEGLDSAGRMLFAGGVSTLSTAANSTDIMSISYIGGTYWGSINKNYS